MDLEHYRVTPGSNVDLAQWATDDDGGLDKDEGRHLARELNERLEELQERLWAEHRHRLLVVLQATDTGGKDGTIRHVFDGVNPQGVKVAAFKKPTERELAHDYLWRVHPHVPGDGEIVIFNRSHYEDVLVVRVHELVPRARWERRYEHINAFEKLLTDEGTTIVKLFLHLSREEQAERLRARLETPHKQWKFSLGDLAERERWDAYQEAFRVMLERTSTPWAPWWVIPADRKWFRNLLVSEILVEVLEALDPRWPPPTDDLTGVEIV
ncbi:MAG: polyphosphate kinase 2 family protein [Actinomyces sp.]|nr:MAG: polyphosphate kinase 2 family protein [Actinomyces sp.]